MQSAKSNGAAGGSKSGAVPGESQRMSKHSAFPPPPPKPAASQYRPNTDGEVDLQRVAEDHHSLYDSLLVPTDVIKDQVVQQKEKMIQRLKVAYQQTTTDFQAALCATFESSVLSQRGNLTDMEEQNWHHVRRDCFQASVSLLGDGEAASRRVVERAYYNELLNMQRRMVAGREAQRLRDYATQSEIRHNQVLLDQTHHQGDVTVERINEINRVHSNQVADLTKQLHSAQASYVSVRSTLDEYMETTNRELSLMECAMRIQEEEAAARAVVEDAGAHHEGLLYAQLFHHTRELLSRQVIEAQHEKAEALRSQELQFRDAVDAMSREHRGELIEFQEEQRLREAGHLEAIGLSDAGTETVVDYFRGRIALLEDEQRGALQLIAEANVLDKQTFEEAMIERHQAEAYEHQNTITQLRHEMELHEVTCEDAVDMQKEADQCLWEEEQERARIILESTMQVLELWTSCARLGQVIIETEHYEEMKQSQDESLFQCNARWEKKVAAIKDQYQKQLQESEHAHDKTSAQLADRLDELSELKLKLQHLEERHRIEIGRMNASFDEQKEELRKKERAADAERLATEATSRLLMEINDNIHHATLETFTNREAALQECYLRMTGLVHAAGKRHQAIVVAACEKRQDVELMETTEQARKEKETLKARHEKALKELKERADSDAATAADTVTTLEQALRDSRQELHDTKVENDGTLQALKEQHREAFADERTSAQRRLDMATEDWHRRMATESELFSLHRLEIRDRTALEHQQLVEVLEIKDAETNNRMHVTTTELNDAHKEAVDDLFVRHKAAMDATGEEHSEILRRVSNEHEQHVTSLQTQIEEIRAERSALSERLEKHRAAAYQQQGDLEVQHAEQLAHAESQTRAVTEQLQEARRSARVAAQRHQEVNSHIWDFIADRQANLLEAAERSAVLWISAVRDRSECRAAELSREHAAELQEARQTHENALKEGRSQASRALADAKEEAKTKCAKLQAAIDSLNEENDSIIKDWDKEVAGLQSQLKQLAENHRKELQETEAKKFSELFELETKTEGSVTQLQDEARLVLVEADKRREACYMYVDALHELFVQQRNTLALVKDYTHSSEAVRLKKLLDDAHEAERTSIRQNYTTQRDLMEQAHASQVEELQRRVADINTECEQQLATQHERLTREADVARKNFADAKSLNDMLEEQMKSVEERLSDAIQVSEARKALLYSADDFYNDQESGRISLHISEDDRLSGIYFTMLLERQQLTVREAELQLQSGLATHAATSEAERKSLMETHKKALEEVKAKDQVIISNLEAKVEHLEAVLAGERAQRTQEAVEADEELRVLTEKHRVEFAEMAHRQQEELDGVQHARHEFEVCERRLLAVSREETTARMRMFGDWWAGLLDCLEHRAHEGSTLKQDDARAEMHELMKRQTTRHQNELQDVSNRQHNLMVTERERHEATLAKLQQQCGVVQIQLEDHVKQREVMKVDAETRIKELNDARERDEQRHDASLEALTESMHSIIRNGRVAIQAERAIEVALLDMLVERHSVAVEEAERSDAMWREVAKDRVNASTATARHRHQAEMQQVQRDHLSELEQRHSKSEDGTKELMALHERKVRHVEEQRTMAEAECERLTKQLSEARMGHENAMREIAEVNRRKLSESEAKMADLRDELAAAHAKQDVQLTDVLREAARMGQRLVELHTEAVGDIANVVASERREHANITTNIEHHRLHQQREKLSAEHQTELNEALHRKELDAAAEAKRHSKVVADHEARIEILQNNAAELQSRLEDQSAGLTTKHQSTVASYESQLEGIMEQHRQQGDKYERDLWRMTNEIELLKESNQIVERLFEVREHMYEKFVIATHDNWQYKHAGLMKAQEEQRTLEKARVVEANREESRTERIRQAEKYTAQMKEASDAQRKEVAKLDAALAERDETLAQLRDDIVQLKGAHEAALNSEREQHRVGMLEAQEKHQAASTALLTGTHDKLLSSLALRAEQVQEADERWRIVVEAFDHLFQIAKLKHVAEGQQVQIDHEMKMAAQVDSLSANSKRELRQLSDVHKSDMEAQAARYKADQDTLLQKLEDEKATVAELHRTMKDATNQLERELREEQQQRTAEIRTLQNSLQAAQTEKAGVVTAGKVAIQAERAIEVALLDMLVERHCVAVEEAERSDTMWREVAKDRANASTATARQRHQAEMQQVQRDHLSELEQRHSKSEDGTKELMALHERKVRHVEEQRTMAEAECERLTKQLSEARMGLENAMREAAETHRVQLHAREADISGLRFDLDSVRAKHEVKVAEIVREATNMLARQHNIVTEANASLAEVVASEKTRWRRIVADDEHRRLGELKERMEVEHAEEMDAAQQRAAVDIGAASDRHAREMSVVQKRVSQLEGEVKGLASERDTLREKHAAELQKAEKHHSDIVAKAHQQARATAEKLHATTATHQAELQLQQDMNALQWTLVTERLDLFGRATDATLTHFSSISRSAMDRQAANIVQIHNQELASVRAAAQKELEDAVAKKNAELAACRDDAEARVADLRSSVGELEDEKRALGEELQALHTDITEEKRKLAEDRWQVQVSAKAKLQDEIEAAQHRAHQQLDDLMVLSGCQAMESVVRSRILLDAYASAWGIWEQRCDDVVRVERAEASDALLRQRAELGLKNQADLESLAHTKEAEFASTLDTHKKVVTVNERRIAQLETEVASLHREAENTAKQHATLATKSLEKHEKQQKVIQDQLHSTSERLKDVLSCGKAAIQAEHSINATLLEEAADRQNVLLEEGQRVASLWKNAVRERSGAVAVEMWRNHEEEMVSVRQQYEKQLDSCKRSHDEAQQQSQQKHGLAVQHLEESIHLKNVEIMDLRRVAKDDKLKFEQQLRTEMERHRQELMTAEGAKQEVQDLLVASGMELESMAGSMVMAFGVNVGARQRCLLDAFAGYSELVHLERDGLRRLIASECAAQFQKQKIQLAEEGNNEVRAAKEEVRVVMNGQLTQANEQKAKLQRRVEQLTRDLDTVRMDAAKAEDLNKRSFQDLIEKHDTRERALNDIIKNGKESHKAERYQLEAAVGREREVNTALADYVEERQHLVLELLERTQELWRRSSTARIRSVAEELQHEFAAKLEEATRSFEVQRQEEANDHRKVVEELDQQRQLLASDVHNLRQDFNTTDSKHTVTRMELEKQLDEARMESVKTRREVDAAHQTEMHLRLAAGALVEDETVWRVRLVDAEVRDFLSHVQGASARRNNLDDITKARLTNELQHVKSSSADRIAVLEGDVKLLKRRCESQSTSMDTMREQLVTMRDERDTSKQEVHDATHQRDEAMRRHIDSHVNEMRELQQTIERQNLQLRSVDTVRNKALTEATSQLMLFDDEMNERWRFIENEATQFNRLLFAHAHRATALVDLQWSERVSADMGHVSRSTEERMQAAFLAEKLSLQRRVSAAEEETRGILDSLYLSQEEQAIAALMLRECTSRQRIAEQQAGEMMVAYGSFVSSAAGSSAAAQHDSEMMQQRVDKLNSQLLEARDAAHDYSQQIDAMSAEHQRELHDISNFSDIIETRGAEVEHLTRDAALSGVEMEYYAGYGSILLEFSTTTQSLWRQHASNLTFLTSQAISEAAYQQERCEMLEHVMEEDRDFYDDELTRIKRAVNDSTNAGNRELLQKIHKLAIEGPGTGGQVDLLHADPALGLGLPPSRSHSPSESFASAVPLQTSTELSQIRDDFDKKLLQAESMIHKYAAEKRSMAVDLEDAKCVISATERKCVQLEETVERNRTHLKKLRTARNTPSTSQVATPVGTPRYHAPKIRVVSEADIVKQELINRDREVLNLKTTAQMHKRELKHLTRARDDAIKFADELKAEMERMWSGAGENGGERGVDVMRKERIITRLEREVVARELDMLQREELAHRNALHVELQASYMSIREARHAQAQSVLAPRTWRSWRTLSNKMMIHWAVINELGSKGLTYHSEMMFKSLQKLLERQAKEFKRANKDFAKHNNELVRFLDSVRRRSEGLKDTPDNMGTAASATVRYSAVDLVGATMECVRDSVASLQDNGRLEFDGEKIQLALSRLFAVLETQLRKMVMERDEANIDFSDTRDAFERERNELLSALEQSEATRRKLEDELTGLEEQMSLLDGGGERSRELEERLREAEAALRKEAERSRRAAAKSEQLEDALMEVQGRLEDAESRGVMRLRDQYTSPRTPVTPKNKKKHRDQFPFLGVEVSDHATFETVHGSGNRSGSKELTSYDSIKVVAVKGAAKAAGLQPLDHITHVNNYETLSTAQFREVLSSSVKPHVPVRVRVVRPSEPRPIDLVLVPDDSDVPVGARAHYRHKISPNEVMY